MKSWVIYLGKTLVRGVREDFSWRMVDFLVSWEIFNLLKKDFVFFSRYVVGSFSVNLHSEDFRSSFSGRSLWF